MNTNTTATAASYYVAKYHNELNTPVYRVTPLADGMENVEYVGNVGSVTHLEDEALELAVRTAQGTGRATGSATCTYDDGKGNRVQWHRNPWALRLTQGVHRALVTLDPEQAALKAELAAQGDTVPSKGDRRVVAELTGYLLVQNRPLEHRDCHCGNGTTTYYVGTVTGVTYWADNSIEATVELPSGRTVRETLVAPHGDACY